MTKAQGPRRRLAVLIMVGLLIVTAVPVGVAVAEPSEGPRGLESALEKVSDLLMRLESELAALERPVAERLEEWLEGAIEAIENLLDQLEAPREEIDEAAWKARIIVLDLQLHRLVYLLEEIVESTPPAVDRPQAEASLERLRVELGSIIMEASFGMEREQFEQLEEAVYRTAHLLGGRIKDLAQKVEPKTGTPRLASLVEKLEGLLFRLDAVILDHFPRRR